MRFSFFAVIVALVASIMSESVSACQGTFQSCRTTSDCCPGAGTCVALVSSNSLPCIDFSPG
ncbi:hypothetical protein BDR03DRAFT_968422, partial [Suillus americanus]